MLGGKTYLAWIPVRGGSRGIKDKNIRLMADKPLIYWCIKAARDSKIFDKIVVNSDSDKILSVAGQYGAELQKRPAELAQDKSLVEDALIEGLFHLPKHDYVQLIQATSPNIRPDLIKSAAKYIQDKKADMIIGVYPNKDPTSFCKELPIDFSLRNWYPEEFKNKNRQDLPTRYSLNGYIYLARWEIFANKCDWWQTNIFAFICGEHDNIDIDDETDWEMAEARLINAKKRAIQRYIPIMRHWLIGGKD